MELPVPARTGVAFVAGPSVPAPTSGLGHLTAPVASSSPEAEALVVRLPDGRTRRWTYAELEQEVQARARALGAVGLRRGDSALLVTARTAELVPTVLALLRAGVAYVPVEASAPDAYWRTVAGLTGARALLGPGPAVRRAAQALPAGTLLVDVSRPVPSEPEPGPAVPAPVPASTTAYVLFTSGSTGTPKGVVVSHGNVAHRLVSYVALTSGPCRYLLHSSLSFDGAVGGMFSTLARGGCLVLVPDAVAADPALAAVAVREERVTHLEPVPSWYAALLDLAGPEDLRSVRTVVLGGEVLPPELVVRSRAVVPSARLFNDYGPTEVTVAATVFEVPAGWTDADVPIGRPHANTVVAVLGEDLAPVPAGALGELWVGGPCVAVGYVGDPDHPAFRELPDAQGRWYRTGDLVRWDADGRLRFGGRRDRQVKIRGQRVEPEEVEAVLGGLPGIVAAAVTVDGDGVDARLVAHVAPARGATLDEEEVLRLLAERLPRHLRPAAALVSPSLPVTAGGKVDRKALPALPRPAEVGEAPRDALERLVADAYEQALGSPVHRRSDFTAAGGQSLAAARVVARLRSALGVDVSLQDLVDAGTPAALATALRGRPAAAPEPPLQRRDRPQGRVWRVPASPRQESFHFLEHVPGGRGRSNLVEVLSFPPGTARAVLVRAVELLLQRHASLRTGLELTADGLVQVVQPHATAPVAELPPARDQAGLLRLADDFGAVPFDLAQAPLLRAATTAGPDGPVLVLVVHHAVADGWSLDLLVHEARAVVAADGSGAGLPGPTVEYVDLVEWTRDRAATRRSAAVEHLTGVLLRAAESGGRMLPTDRPPAARPDVRAGLVTDHVPPEVLSRAAELGRSVGGTVYSVLAASLGILLARGSGQDEVVLTGPLSGRGEPALDHVVGCCINTGLFPVDVSGDPTFADVVRRVAAEATAAAPHAWLPLEVPLRPLPEGAREDVGRVLLNLLEHGEDRGPVPGRHSRPSTMAYADLDLYLEHRDGGLTVDAVHSLARLDGSTVERLLRRWATLLSVALADPDRPARDLPLLTAEEAASLDVLESGPRPGGTVPAIASVPDEARERLHEDPDAVAVVDASGPWTRQELWDRAGAVAELLDRRGAAPGSRVVVALDGDADAVAALLGCWRVGAVPVPVGANQPPSRVAVVARASAAVEVLDPATMLEAADQAAGRDVPTGARDPAYVLFTSGSTGEPKGVVVSHGALAASTSARLAAYPDAPATALVTHDLAFDAGLGVIAWYLCTGGRLVMAGAEDRLDPEQLARLVRRHDVGQLDIVPSHHRLLLDLAPPGMLAGLRLVTLGGEACPPSLVAVHRAVVPAAVLVNEYGPTESTVWALAHTCAAADERAERVPVGRPVAGVVARVADARGHRLPPGAEGELLLSGDLLADGYLADPAATAARFVEHDGTRWYRTGDRARWGVDGELDFLGRDDAQVKVRGFRIELAEVETALGRLDGVVRAAAGTAEVVEGAPLLVGWVQLAPAAAADGLHTPERLRDDLLEQLPDWLVPGLLVLVADLPETTAGKLDRTRLPTPQHAAVPGDPPATPTEMAVAAIWEDVLGRPVPADRSFFALGGQSLLAARMVARVRAELAADVGLAAVLATPRVRDVAALVDAHRAGAPAAPSTAAPRSPSLADIDDVLSRVDDLDDDEVAALLAEMEQS